MKTFDEMCLAFEAMDPLSYTVLLTKKAATVLPALAIATGSLEMGMATFGTFILGAVAADGKLSEEEYREKRKEILDDL